MSIFAENNNRNSRDENQFIYETFPAIFDTISQLLEDQYRTHDNCSDYMYAYNIIIKSINSIMSGKSHKSFMYKYAYIMSKLEELKKSVYKTFQEDPEYTLDSETNYMTGFVRRENGTFVDLPILTNVLNTVITILKYHFYDMLKVKAVLFKTDKYVPDNYTDMTGSEPAHKIYIMLPSLLSDYIVIDIFNDGISETVKLLEFKINKLYEEYIRPLVSDHECEIDRSAAAKELAPSQQVYNERALIDWIYLIYKIDKQMAETSKDIKSIKDCDINFAVDIMGRVKESINEKGNNIVEFYKFTKELNDSFDDE